MLERSLAATAGQLGEDGEAYRRLVDPVVSAWHALEPVVLGPLPPPVRRIVSAISPRPGAHGLSSARSLAERTFETERARRSFRRARRALDAAARSERPSGGIGLVLPRRRPRLRLGVPPGWLATAHGRAGGASPRARRGDPHARARSRSFRRPMRCSRTSSHASCSRLRATGSRLATPSRSERYRHGPGAFKLDWALDGPIPWRRRGVPSRRDGAHRRDASTRSPRRSEAAWAGSSLRAPLRPPRPAEPLRRLASPAGQAHGLGLLPRPERLDART